MTVRTRFAPSPTGVLHLGSVRTALFCWLYARHCSGTYILRIEDTDTERSTKASVDAILDGLAWLRLQPDEGPFYQTDRFDRYREVIQQWLAEGKAYRCYCTREELAALREQQVATGATPRYNGKCRDGAKPRPGIDPVIRFRSPTEGSVIINDLIRGRVEISNSELDDLIIARSNGVPTYNFTVVVDDADMRITHVIRGDDHLNNTPKQINMMRAMGVELPEFAHLPMILGPDGARLSKRHGAVNVLDYRDAGYLPDALLNYLVRLGWSHGDQEIFSRAEMISLFDIPDVNASASTFNAEKLLWLNQQHIIAMPIETLSRALVPFLKLRGIDLANGPSAESVVDAYRERARTLVEMAESCSYCYSDFDDYDPDAAKKHLRPVIGNALAKAREALRKVSHWNRESIHLAIVSVAEGEGMNLGKLGQPIRVAVTGGGVSPPLDVTLELIGQDRTVQRLERALTYIADRTEATTAG